MVAMETSSRSSEPGRAIDSCSLTATEPSTSDASSSFGSMPAEFCREPLTGQRKETYHIFSVHHPDSTYPSLLM